MLLLRESLVKALYCVFLERKLTLQFQYLFFQYIDVCLHSGLSPRIPGLHGHNCLIYCPLRHKDTICP